MIRLFGQSGDLVRAGDDERPIGLDAPGDCLSRDRAKGFCWEHMRRARLSLRDAHHFTNLNDDVGERMAALLLCHYPRLYGEPKRIDERKESLIILGHEVVALPDNGNRGIFHGAPWRSVRRRQ